MRCRACYPGDPLVQCSLAGDHLGLHTMEMTRRTPTRLMGEIVTWREWWEHTPWDAGFVERQNAAAQQVGSFPEVARRLEQDRAREEADKYGMAI